MSLRIDTIQSIQFILLLTMLLHSVHILQGSTSTFQGFISPPWKNEKFSYRTCSGCGFRIRLSTFSWHLRIFNIGFPYRWRCRFRRYKGRCLCRHWRFVRRVQAGTFLQYFCICLYINFPREFFPVDVGKVKVENCLWNTTPKGNCFNNMVVEIS